MKARIVGRTIVWGTMVAGVLLGAVLSARAQGQAGAQVAVQAAPQQAAPPTALPSPAGSPQRDPFRPIEIKRPAVAVDVAPNCTQAGKQGLLLGQLRLQGIASSVEGQWIAVVDNKTGRAYFLRAKDELCNGVVTRIDQGSLVIEERTVDSFGRTRTREVVLRPPQE